MKKLLAILAMTLSLNAMASTQGNNTIDVSKLTAEQKAQVMAVVEQKKAEVPAKTVDAVLTRVEQFGASAARGLVGFAKEIGTEANNFAQTPLGMIVAGFTVLHFFGHEITSLLVGVVFSFIIAPILLTLFIRSFRCVDYTYEYKPVVFGLFNKKYVTKVEKRYMSDAEQIRIFVLGGATVIATLIGITHFVI